MDGYVVTVERVIPAPPEAIFAYLADAARHPEIDGSGTVKGAKAGVPERLSLGSKFGMSMKMGVPYSMVSTVTEFEDNRLIAWQSYLSGPLGKFVGGRTWRYQLEPVDGGTRVSESWDLSNDKQRALLKLGKLPEQTRTNMEKTLERIEQLVA
ncbi:MAG: SRPBCC family protein [Acidimicrobiales bacterium]